MTKNSRDLEILVQKIQQQLSPDAEVLHDVKLPGKDGKRMRQIDVLVRQKIGQYEMLIVLDCKDHKRPVDINGVGAFHALVTDVGAHRGVLVCPTGFTSGAKTRATELQIDLFSPVDTDPHKWQIQAAVPAVCDFRNAWFSFRLSCSAPKPLTLPGDFWHETAAFDAEHQKLGVAFDAAMQKWNEGFFPSDPGEHPDLDIFDETTVYVDNGYGDIIPVDLTVSLRVEQQLYFGQLPLSQISGFKDELSGRVITNAFTIGVFDAVEVERDWTPIGSEEELPMAPVIKLIGLIGSGESGGSG